MANNSKFIIFFVDDDLQVLCLLKCDFCNVYKEDYCIISMESVNEGLEVLDVLKKKGEEVVLFIFDQWMLEMLGVEFLECVWLLYLEVKWVLFIVYFDIDVVIKVINDVQFDYYFFKFWDLLQEWFYFVFNDLFEEWQVGFKLKFWGICVVGYNYFFKFYQVKDFLVGNLLFY